MTDDLIIEPRAEAFTVEDPAAPTVGKWYWLKTEVEKVVGWTKVPEDSEEEPEPIKEEQIGKEFVCVVRLGSNYAKVENLSGHTWRIHLDEFHDECEWIQDPQRIIAGETKARQGVILALMQDVREVTARLAITPGLGLPGGPLPSESQSLGLVLAKGKSAEEYKTSLVKAEKENLPQLFARIKEEHAEMAKWMKAPLVPLQAASDAMKPAISAIKDRLFSVELYAGLCEEVVKIKDGESAPLQEKIRIFQRRAYMDEECLAAYEHGGMDYKSLDDFDRWLCKPAQLERLMPFPRCVLAFQIRRSRKEREMVSIKDYFRIRDEEQWDKSTFLYIRNGQRMYRLETTIDFDEQLFPDMRRQEPNGKLYARSRDSWIDGYEDERPWWIIGENELRAMQEAHEKSVAEWKARIKKVPKKDRWQHNNREPEDRHLKYEPFDKTNVYYDDIAKSIADDAARHNRLVLVLQGILDRSEALHPHPPWSLWRQDSFEVAVELLYDEVRALTPGEAPDFEAYRAKCNASLRVGSVTLGQEHRWLRVEAAKENERQRHGRHSDRFRDLTTYHPPGNPGPGKFAHVVQVRVDEVAYQWSKKRRGHEYDTDSSTLEVGCRFVTNASNVFNVDAYKPGDFRLFFSDPRTRAAYLKWAPILLEAEEYHAGNREVAPVRPMPPRKKNQPGGSYEYRLRKSRQAMVGKAVRLKQDVRMRSGDVNKKGTLWRVLSATAKGYHLMQISLDGKQLLTGKKGHQEGHFMDQIQSYYFEVVENVPAAPAKS